MSRLAKKPIVLPKGVECKVSEGKVSFKGPKGEMINEVPKELDIAIEGNEMTVSVKKDVKIEKPTLGLYRALLNNSALGVFSGFEKKLQLIGVGYRVAMKGTKLDLQLGFSHPCELDIPKGIKIEIDKATMIVISGVDKRLVGHFAAEIRGLKPPEPYKGKGIRYIDEYVRKKAGKAAKGKG